MKQKIISTGWVVALIIAIVALFTPVSSVVQAPAPVANNLGGGITNYDSLVLNGGICSVSTAVNVSSLQLTAGNLTGCPVLVITSGTTTATLTVTLPATSTMSGILQAIGDTTSINIYAASTTAGNIVLAATTTGGFTLESPVTVASSTAATTTILAGKMGNLNYSKIPTTDFIGIFTPAR